MIFRVIVIATVLIALLYAVEANILVSFSKEYFMGKYIQYLVVFGCWSSFDTREFFKRDIMSHLTVSYVPIRKNLEMRAILKVNYYKLGIILDLDCPRSEIILEQFTENQLPYNESYFWLMMTKSNTVPVDALRDLPLSIATEITVALRGNDTYMLYDVYNFSHRHGGRLNVTYMGYWSVKEGLRNHLTQYKYKRRQNFNKLSLNFSIHVDHEPIPDFHTYILNPINRHVDTMMRYNYGLILQLVDYYNISMNLIRGKTWGYLINGTWNGIVADMIRGVVDISVTPFQYKMERLDVVAYTVQSYRARASFIFRHPKTSDVHNVFLMPFTEDVWYLIVIVAFIYWLILLLTVKIELHYDNYPKSCTLDTNPASETALITAAALCQQGLSDGPRIYSGRIVFLSLFLWGLLLLQFYSASVVGSLLSEPPRFINTLKDLSDSNLEIGLEDMAYTYDYFAKTTDPVAHELHRKKVQLNKKRTTTVYCTAEEGLKKVQKGGYAFHVDVATAYKIIEDTFEQDEICDLAEVQLWPLERIATGVGKHSPFKKMVTYGTFPSCTRETCKELKGVNVINIAHVFVSFANIFDPPYTYRSNKEKVVMRIITSNKSVTGLKLRQIVEHGTPGHLAYVWQASRPQCPESYSAMPVPVALKEFSAALFSLFMGIALALFVMLIEMYVDRRERRRRAESTESFRISQSSWLQPDPDQLEFHKIGPSDVFN